MRFLASPTELMCIILDTNAFSDYVNEKPYMQPVRRWLEGGKGVRPKGKLVYSPTPVIEKEIRNHAKFGLSSRHCDKQGESRRCGQIW